MSVFPFRTELISLLCSPRRHPPVPSYSTNKTIYKGYIYSTYRKYCLHLRNQHIIKRYEMVILNDFSRNCIRFRLLIFRIGWLVNAEFAACFKVILFRVCLYGLVPVIQCSNENVRNSNSNHQNTVFTSRDITLSLRAPISVCKRRITTNGEPCWQHNFNLELWR